MNPDDDTPVDELVREHAQRSFGPGFADRVMARVEAERDEAFADLVAHGFRWLAAAATIAALALGAWGVFGDWEGSEQPWVRRAFVQDSPTIESLYQDAFLDPTAATSQERSS